MEMEYIQAACFYYNQDFNPFISVSARFKYSEEASRAQNEICILSGLPLERRGNTISVYTTALKLDELLWDLEELGYDTAPY